MGSIRPRWRSFAVAMIATLIGVCALPPLAALAQTSPVQEARTLYEQAQFDEAITLLRSALSTGLVAGREALAAREMIARCLVRTGNRIEAKEAFKGLLYLNPSYRPSAGSMPPDELEVYELAREEFTAEEIEAGERVPASLAFSYGFGSGNNSDLAEVAASLGGDDAFDADPSFGGAVRFPISPRWSLEIEMQRFRATNSDTTLLNFEYEVTALPLVLSVYYAMLTNPRWRVNVFGGLGSLLAATSTVQVDIGTARIGFSDQKNGFYGHAGVEGEYLVHPRFAGFARLLGRVATASDLYSDAADTSPFKGRDLSFSGFGAHIGLRAYIGY